MGALRFDLGDLDRFIEVNRNRPKALLEYARGWQRAGKASRMGIYKRGNVYWIDYYDPNRKRVQESSQSSSRRDAEGFLALRKSEILRGVYKQPVKDLARRIRRPLYGACEGKQAVVVARRTNA